MRSRAQLGEQRRAGRRANFLVGAQQHFVAQFFLARFLARQRFERLQRRKHHRQSAFHVGDARSSQHDAVLAPGLLKRVRGGKHRVVMPGEGDLQRRGRAHDDANGRAMRYLNQFAIRTHALRRRQRNFREFAGQ